MSIFRLFTKRRKRLPDAVFENRLQIARHHVRRAGDEVREMNRWKTDYQIRTGRAA